MRRTCAQTSFTYRLVPKPLEECVANARLTLGPEVVAVFFYDFQCLRLLLRISIGDGGAGEIAFCHSRAAACECRATRHSSENATGLQENVCAVSLLPRNSDDTSAAAIQSSAHQVRIPHSVTCDLPGLAHRGKFPKRRVRQQVSGPTRPRAPCYEQQVGSQQADGFVARTNALMNLPSTSDAIASTSTPSRVRN